MKFIKSKKGLVLLATLVVAAAAAIGGYAYFTSTGAGQGSASVGSSGAITLTSNAVSGLYPGGAAKTVTLNVFNNNAGDEYVGTISGSVEDITTGPNAGCMGSWFSVAPVTYNTTVLAGATTHPTTTISMPSDTVDNQNACQGAALTIDWSSN